MNPLEVFWAVVIAGALIGGGITAAVVVRTGADYTHAVARLEDVDASRTALARSLRDAETEVTWLRAQLAGAGLQVGMPPAGDRTRRLVRATRDGVVVVQEGKP